MRKYLGYDSIKRFSEIFFAIFLMIALLPCMAVIVVVVFASTRENPFFCQKRITKDGRIFPMFKFRTMRSKNQHLANGARFTSRNDPRVTAAGRFLRRTRLDELPQLFNIVRGEMSFIGPRPERPELVEELCLQLPLFRERLLVLAGLTGLAQVQVGYANDVQRYRRKLNCDLIYIRHRGFKLDAWIIIKTVSVVIRGKGAC